MPSGKVLVRQENTNPNFWVRISADGVQAFHVNGWGPEKFGVSLKAQENQIFWWDILGFGRDIAGVP